MSVRMKNAGIIILAATMSFSGTAAAFADVTSVGAKGAVTSRSVRGTEAETEPETEIMTEEEQAETGASAWTWSETSEAEKNSSTGIPVDDDLYRSMHALATEIDDLTTETKNLRGQIEDLQRKQEEEDAEEAAQAAEAEPETEQPGVPMEEKKFLKGIRKSLKKRTQAAVSYSESELGAMTNDELVEANAACCEEEREFYEKYRNAVFENKDIQYLCGQYMAGLKNQFDAYDTWKENGNISLYNELWDAGYAKRACAVCELADQYEIDFGDITEMRKKVEALEKKNGETPANTLGYEAVAECQNCLNTLGFKNVADGSWGARTSKMLKRFQLMYGYGPVDGVLTEEILGKLREEAAKVAPPETEAQTEAQTEAAS